MSQASGIQLDTSVGYLLKEASSVLRTSMEAALQPLGLSVTEYSCLELLAQRPGVSNSELARGTFITRQSMSVLLHSLEGEGLVTRAVEAPVGKVVPVRLTAEGRRVLDVASRAVRNVEDAMLADITASERSTILQGLRKMVLALRSDPGAG